MAFQTAVSSLMAPGMEGGWSGDNPIYTLTNPEKATGHEGHTVKVTGKTDDSAKTLTIDTLEMAAK